MASCYSLLRFALHPPKAAAGGLGRPGAPRSGTLGSLTSDTRASGPGASADGARGAAPGSRLAAPVLGLLDLLLPLKVRVGEVGAVPDRVWNAPVRTTYVSGGGYNLLMAADGKRHLRGGSYVR